MVLQRTWLDRRLLAIAMLVAAGMIVAPAATAHTSGADDGVAVSLHLEPNDSPIAGRETVIHLDYTSDDFELGNCDCRVIVRSSNGARLASLPVTESNDGYNGRATYTFPARGAYRLEAEGTAKQAAFASFEVPFAVNVDRSNDSAARQTTTQLRLTLGAVIVCAALAAGVWWLRARRKSSR